MAPVRSVTGEGDVGASEREVLSGHELGSAGEDVVVGFKDEFGESGRRYDQGGDSAESKEEDGAELVSESGEGVVGHGCEEVKVADYGKSFWRWWDPSGLSSTEPAGQAYDVGKGDGAK